MTENKNFSLKIGLFVCTGLAHDLTMESPTTELENPPPTKERSRNSKRNSSSKRHSAKSKHPKTLNLTDVLTPESTHSPSTPTSMSIESPSSQSVERLFLSSDGSSGNDSVGTLKSPADSREKLVYTKYGDGLLNENKLTFANVASCFLCDNEEQKTRSHDDVRYRAYSSGAIGPHDLIQSRQKTGYKLGKDGPVPVYRTVFLCLYCTDDIKKKRFTDPNFSLKITTKALAYFSGVQ